jgi:hypothetical protein
MRYLVFILFTFTQLPLGTLAESLPKEKKSVLGVACAKECPTYKNVDVCFIDKEFVGGIKVSNSGSCQGVSDIRIVRQPSDIVTALANIATACLRVSKMIFVGHGNPVAVVMGTKIWSNQWIKLDPHLSCPFAKDAHIDIRSCNIGKGCDGQKQMYNIARAFLGDKQGTIIAPTQVATTDPFEILKARSINGKYRTLKYLGPKEEPIFGYEGIVLSAPTAHQVCIEDIAELKELVQRTEKIMKKKNCSKDLSYYRTGIHDLESIFSNPNIKMSPSPDTFSMYKEYILDVLGMCIKDNYRKKLVHSNRAEDQPVLQHLHESKRAPVAPRKIPVK